MHSQTPLHKKQVGATGLSYAGWDQDCQHFCSVGSVCIRSIGKSNEIATNYTYLNSGIKIGNSPS